MGINYKKWVSKYLKPVGIDEAVFTNLSAKKSDYEKWINMIPEDRLPRPKYMDYAALYTKTLADGGYRFVIFGDYDADGITSTSILTLGLKKYGVENVNIIIPDRLNDGYGATKEMVDSIKETEDITSDGKPKIAVIFVDNGIKCFDAVNECNRKGYTSIILDHHEGSKEPGKYPLADMIVDSCIFDDDDTEYCGAGLSYIFIRELLKEEAPEYHEKLLPLAAIGTVADVMPLKAGNYAIVKEGLKLMAESFKRGDRTGLNFLLADALPFNPSFDAKDIGFTIAPIINAQSRMRGKKGEYDAVSLLIAENIPDKYQRYYENLADTMIQTNTERKAAKNASIDEAEKLISDECLYGEDPIVCYLPDTSEGIIGITAGYLVEKYKVPAYVFTNSNKDGILKGSGRSAGDYNMIAMLDELDKTSPEIFAGYGGHPGAAGLSIKHDKLDDFIQGMQMLSSKHPYLVPDPDRLIYDISMDEKDFFRDLDKIFKDLDAYGPFGEGNPELKFKVTNFHIKPNPKYRNLFMEGKSAKLYGADNFCCYAFGMADKISDDIRTCDMIGTLRKSYFGGKETIDFEIIDLKDITTPAEETETPFAKMLREMSSNTPTK